MNRHFSIASLNRSSKIIFNFDIRKDNTKVLRHVSKVSPIHF